MLLEPGGARRRWDKWFSSNLPLEDEIAKTTSIANGWWKRRGGQRGRHRAVAGEQVGDGGDLPEAERGGGGGSKKKGGMRVGSNQGGGEREVKG
mgnify:CR=1 FL=1